MFLLVAGPGIEPGPEGYEPSEMPLLYPAVYDGWDCTTKEYALQALIDNAEVTEDDFVV